jgi:hypothetical protein
VSELSVIDSGIPAMNRTMSSLVVQTFATALTSLVVSKLTNFSIAWLECPTV